MAEPVAPLGDQHVLAVALVFRRHQPHTAFLQQAPDDRVLGAFDDLDDAALWPAAPVVPRDAHAHAVLVEHRPHLVGGDIDVGIAVVALHESVAVAVALHAAFDFVIGVRDVCNGFGFLIYNLSLS